MKLTNRTSLPEPLVLLAERYVNSHPAFDNGTYSVTELLRSVRQVVLSRRFSEQIEQDVQDTFNMWSGTGVHDSLEIVANEHPELELITEERFSLDLGEGISVSGGFDLYDRKSRVLYDYKTTKVATYESNRDGREDKWLKQLYLYCLGIEKLYGDKPEKVVIVAMLKDHSKMKVGLKSGYPEHPIMMIEWDVSDILQFEGVLGEYKDKAMVCRSLLENGDEPPMCTFSDCWCTEDWCVKKPGAKKADKKFDTPEEAVEYYEGLPAESRKERRILHRVSDFNNCRNYCTCSGFCSQGQKNKDFEAFEEDVTDELESGYVPF